jgi:hypothetical protein
MHHNVNISICTFQLFEVQGGHSMEHEIVPFIYRLKLHTLFINGKYEATIDRQ